MQDTWRKLIGFVCLALGTSLGTIYAQEPETIVSEGTVMGETITLGETIMGETIMEGGMGPLCPWYVQVGAVVLRRNVASSTVFVTDPNGKALVTSRDFDFNWGAGPEVLIGHMLTENIAVEVDYFGNYGMNASLTQAGQGIPAGGNTLVTNFFADYRSSLTNVEVNGRYWLDCELSILGGFRFVNWHEEMTGGYTIPAVTTTTPSTAPGALVNRNLATLVTPAKLVSFADLTNNNLYGVQAGIDWQHSFGRFGVDAYTKLGLFGNEAYGRGTFVNSNGITTSASLCQGQVAFLDEIALVGTFKLNDAITLRAGYTIMWIEGIAIVPQQTQAFSGGNGTLNSHSGVFLQGFIAGGEVRW